MTQQFLKLGGRFTLSDDSHGTEQVGLNYNRVFQCIELAGIKELHHFGPIDAASKPPDERFPAVQWEAVPVSDLKGHAFWSR